MDAMSQGKGSWGTRILFALMALVIGAVGLAAVLGSSGLVYVMAKKPVPLDATFWLVAGVALLVFGLGIYLLSVAVRLVRERTPVFTPGQPGQRRKLQVFQRAMLGVLILLVARLRHEESVVGYVCQVLAVAAMFALGGFLTIACHEGGHLLAAWLVGFRPYLVRIGTGVEWLAWQTGGLKWSLGRSLFTGYVMAHPRGRSWERWRLFLFVLGGPLATLGLLGAAYGFCEWRDVDLSIYQDALWKTAAALFFYLNLLVLAGVLIPKMAVVDGRTLQTDMSVMLTCLFASRKAWEESPWGHKSLSALWRTGRVKEAWERFGSKLAPVGANAHHSANFATFLEADEAPAIQGIVDSLLAGDHLTAEQKAWLLWAKGAALAHLGEPAEARVFFADAMEAAPTAPHKIGLCELAAILIICGRLMEYLPEADAASQLALDLNPKSITLRGTRASILAEQGRLADARPMLEDVYARTQADLDRTICAYYLARIHRQEGREEEATLWLKKMHGHSPPEWLVERAKAEGFVVDSPEAESQTVGSG